MGPGGALHHRSPEDGVRSGELTSEAAGSPSREAGRSTGDSKKALDSLSEVKLFSSTSKLQLQVLKSLQL